ncbi:MAG TPA: helix-hairpin-helix domain-containing protein [Dongiaceae bacterium]|nr:helix-hairpin-helix domain-containing protein [Dongiaceae bacterium]
MLKFLAKLFAATPTDQVCADCGSKLFPSPNSAATYCPNPDCPARVRRWLVHWATPEVMNVPGLDAALAEQLVSSGLIRDVGELYTLQAAEVAALPGRNPATAELLVTAIATSKARPLEHLLHGLEIPHVDAAVAQALARQFFRLDAVFSAGEPKLAATPGVGPDAARSLVRWYGDPVNRRLIERLRKAGLNFYAQPERS